MHANCNRTTHGFAQLNIEYSILYYAMPCGPKEKQAMLFYLFPWVSPISPPPPPFFFFVQVSKRQLNENKTSRKSENEKSNYTAQ